MFKKSTNAPKPPPHPEVFSRFGQFQKVIITLELQVTNLFLCQLIFVEEHVRLVYNVENGKIRGKHGIESLAIFSQVETWAEN